jgi:hypothetical protein
MLINKKISTVEEDYIELSEEMKKVLDERLMENDRDYLTAEESIAQMKDKYK